MNGSSRPLAILWMLALLACFCCPGARGQAAAPGAAAASASASATSSTSPAPVPDPALKEQQLKLQARELDIKAADLKFRQDDAESTRRADNWKTWITFASTLAAIVAVAATVFSSLRSLETQRNIANEQAKLQFQMKAVDFVLQSSMNSQQAKERARALVALFDSRWLPTKFAEDFKAVDFRIDAGSSQSRRMELVKLLAEHPQGRVQILKDWCVVHRGDWWFVDPLLSDLSEDERTTLRKVIDQVEQNDLASTKKAEKPATGA